MKLSPEMVLALDDQQQYVKDHVQKEVVGYFCSFAPEEIIHAAGFHPMRLYPGYNSTDKADEHIQAYACSVVRNAFHSGLDNRYDFVKGVIFPHSCDSYQRLSDLWRLNRKDTFLADIVFPVKQGSSAAVSYTRDIIKRFMEILHDNGGRKITDDDLAFSIKLFNDIRRKVKEINEKQTSGRVMHTITRAALAMDKEDILELLDGISFDKKENNGPAVLATGSVCDTGEAVALIEEAGMYVRHADLCTGMRPFADLIDEKKEPLDALAEFYTTRKLCASKHTSLESRLNDIIELVNGYDLKGVIFLTMKFCEPYQFDYPYLKGELDARGIPSLLLEVESPIRNKDQFLTRLETFQEGLK